MHAPLKLLCFHDLVTPVFCRWFFVILIEREAHFESNYSYYNYSSNYSNYSSIRTSIVATIVLLEINGGSEHRYSSRLSGPPPPLALSNRMGSRFVGSLKTICFRK